jgi:hypothetical protein
VDYEGNFQSLCDAHHAEKTARERAAMTDTHHTTSGG